MQCNRQNVLPNQELPGAKSELQRETVGVCSSYKWALPTQELSGLFISLNYRGFLYFPRILRVNMTSDLAHLQLSDL